jgi:RNA polymerase sigma factor (sigma-70 family)
MYDDFEVLEKKHRLLIFKFIKNKYVDGCEQEDLYQECLMVLDKCNKDFDATKSTKFSTYFFTAMRNHIFDMIKTSNRDKRPSFIDAEIDEIPQEVDDSVDEESNTRLNSEMLSELSKMPRGRVTYMIVVEGMTMQQVAEIEKVSKQRVHYLHKRNLEKLKKIFG